jgi:hypothetical protein
LWASLLASLWASLWASLAPYLKGKVQLQKMSDEIPVEFEASTAANVKTVAFWI